MLLRASEPTSLYSNALGRRSRSQLVLCHVHLAHHSILETWTWQVVFVPDHRWILRSLWVVDADSIPIEPAQYRHLHNRVPVCGAQSVRVFGRRLYRFWKTRANARRSTTRTDPSESNHAILCRFRCHHVPDPSGWRWPVNGSKRFLSKDRR